MLLSSLSQRVLDGLCEKWTHGQSASSANNRLQDAEDFVAMQIVAFLSYVFLHLRYLLVSSVVGAIALLLSVSSYPFFPQQTMINFSWTVLLLLSGLYMLIFAQMSRNYVLSRIASKPTGFTLDRVFVSQTVTFGVLPVVAFLGTRFPALGRILYSWTGPLLKIFN